DLFEKTAGISGEDNNPFCGRRPSAYPTRPKKKTTILQRVESATTNLGLSPFMIASASLSDAYEDPVGQQINACLYCGFCERFGCEYGAKTSAEITVVPTARETGNYGIKFNANGVEIMKEGDRVTGLRYYDTETFEEFI